MSKKIVYIIPLHKKDKRVFRAIASVPDDAQIFIVHPKKLKLDKWFDKVIRKDGTNNISVFNDVEGSSYPQLVNRALRYIANRDGEPEFDYISILEFDDTLTPNAHKIINEYAEHWDNEILAPLSCVVKHVDGEDTPLLIGVANEASMAPQVAEEFGTFDFNMMLRTNFLFMNGCYIKPSVFEDYGLLKENFEMFYDYEWALRVVYNGGSIRSIPKATHFHEMSPDGAFETQKKADKKTRENWLGASRREYFFDEDRDISFD